MFNGVVTEPFPSYGIVIIVLGLLLMIVSISAVFVYRWTIAMIHTVAQKSTNTEEYFVTLVV